MAYNSGISVEMNDTKKAMAKIVRGQQYGAKAVQATVRDFKTRAPAWISQAITGEYTIKKKDITAAKKGAKVLGKTKIAGVAVDKIAIEYKGRPLTLIHFKTTPKTRPQRKYKVKTEIKKGQQKIISGAFLGNNGGGQDIPWMRETKKAYPIKPLKTVGVPKMISTNEKVQEDIQELIDENMAKRLEHHLARYQAKLNK